jgi:hypothetical protein
MRDRDLVPAAVICRDRVLRRDGARVGRGERRCIGATGRFTAVSLGIVVLIAWRLDRHRSSGSPDPADRAWGAEETSR